MHLNSKPNAPKLVEMQCWIVIMIVLHVLQVQACDLEKHYLNDNKECCDMCRPGTRMPNRVDCKEPACVNCQKNEYQEGYTTNTKCSLQPYCDPNLHMEPTPPITMEHISPCRCMEGFHCVNELCATCVLNSQCPPGFKVSENATQKTDTKCDECPPGTFSAAFSLESSCQPWTECNNDKPRQQGTTMTDNICKDGKKTAHIGVAVFATIFVLVVIVGIIIFCLKGKCEEPCPKNVLNVWTKTWEKEKRQDQFEPLKNKEDIEAGMNEQTLRQAEENEVKEDETDRTPVQMLMPQETIINYTRTGDTLEHHSSDSVKQRKYQPVTTRGDDKRLTVVNCRGNARRTANIKRCSWKE
ncbi:tumor necrosis factor receptor superfamily member 5 isoform X1 [Alosa sapidissima]|uniref:tumor necrosis factor receptor superfamily member 5 isoform X1 n=1 Tax=Alosa sapidissima TaxID=34773 RepID=UPI001C096DC3|nr:tumor necrosis factor receptor superfamily member 5 isoform X1 [Alosa sapidissima]